MFKPEDFSRMLLLDRGSFDRTTLRVRVPALGVPGRRADASSSTSRRRKESRSTATARGDSPGRIWVEDQAYHIVRYNGIYASTLAANFHFDSWRMNVAPNAWLPAYVYTEESDKTSRQLNLTYRGQIRVWGYQLEQPNADDEFTKVMLESVERGRTPTTRRVRGSPVESARQWQLEAEENVVRRLEGAGLLAPRGKLDAILETVVNNLEVTNGIEMDPPVHCRVLLTTPLESFTVGRTIVISRGLIDVLPDEASLAAGPGARAGTRHERARARHALRVHRSRADRRPRGGAAVPVRAHAGGRGAGRREGDRSARATRPTRTSSRERGLFLKALDAQAPALRALIRPHFGNQQVYRMTADRQCGAAARPGVGAADRGAAARRPSPRRSMDRPRGAAADQPRRLVSAREKMPFQVTPLMPYLSRLDGSGEPAKAKTSGDRAERRQTDRSRGEVGRGGPR